MYRCICLNIDDSTSNVDTMIVDIPVSIVVKYLFISLLHGISNDAADDDDDA